MARNFGNPPPRDPSLSGFRLLFTHHPMTAHLCVYTWSCCVYPPIFTVCMSPNVKQTFIPPFTCHTDPQDWMVSGFLYCSVEALCVFHPIQQVIKIIITAISPSPRHPKSIVFFVILIVWFCGYRMLSYCALLDNVFVWLCETF